MSVFTPGRRWQPPFMPFKRTTFKKRALAKIEIAIKGPLFGCRMCGNCLLQETAFICPMECPKGLRNGPCGGSTPEKCYVDESRPCVWYKIYERSFKLGREALLLEALPPWIGTPRHQTIQCDARFFHDTRALSINRFRNCQDIRRTHAHHKHRHVGNFRLHRPGTNTGIRRSGWPRRCLRPGCNDLSITDWPRPNTGALLLAHLNAPPPDARELVYSLPRNASHAIQHAMAKEPASRFATAGEFITVLECA